MTRMRGLIFLATLSVALGFATARLERHEALNGECDANRVLAVGDFNGDGVGDIMGSRVSYDASPSSLSYQWALLDHCFHTCLGSASANGTLRYAASALVFCVSADSPPVVLDLDGDGVDELLMRSAGCSAHCDFLFAWNGTSGAWEDVSERLPMSVQYYPYQYHANFDLHRGGNRSLLYYSIGNYVGRLFDRDPLTGAWAEVWTDTLNYDILELDVNMDGWNDLVQIHSNDGRVSWLENLNGTLSTTPVELASFPTLDILSRCGSPIAPRVWPERDFTGDGRPDLCLLANTASGNSIYVLVHQAQAPWFATSAVLRTVAPNGLRQDALATGDVNGDGLADLVHHTEFGFWNDATHPGTFKFVPLHAVAGNAAVLSTVTYNTIYDVNGDGKNDVLGIPSYVNVGVCGVGTAAAVVDVRDFDVLYYNYGTLLGDLLPHSHYGCSVCIDSVALAPDAIDCAPCPLGSHVTSPSSCQKCSSGTFSANGVTCVACPADTVAVVGSANCSVCPAGSLPDTQGAYCNDCPAGTFWTNVTLPSRCLTCMVNSVAPAGSLACEACQVGKVPSADHSHCVACGPGLVFNSFQCVACPARSAAINDSCVPCDPGYIPAEGQGSCVACPAGTHSDGQGACVACDANAAAPEGSAACSVCHPGEGAAFDGGSCVTCPRGTFSADGICEPCPIGMQASETGATSCAPCEGCGLAGAIVLPSHARANSVATRLQNGLPADETAYVDGVQQNLLWGALAALLTCGFIAAMLAAWSSRETDSDEVPCYRASRFDVFFTDSHRVALIPGPLVRRRTVGGALLSVTAGLVLIFVTAGLALRFARANVAVSMSQLPLQLLPDGLPSINIQLSVGLFGYAGATCDAMNVGFQTNGISGMTGTVTAGATADAPCTINLSCGACAFSGATGSVSVQFTDGSAYGQALVWNISAAANTNPEGTNWVGGTLAAPQGSLIQGRTPSTAISASLYYQRRNSTVHEERVTAGDQYVVGLIGTQLGAQTNASSFQALKSPGVQVDITLEREAFFVLQQIDARQSLIAFASSLAGAISGVLVLAKFLLAVAEELAAVRGRRTSPATKDVELGPTGTASMASNSVQPVGSELSNPAYDLSPF